LEQLHFLLSKRLATAIVTLNLHQDLLLLELISSHDPFDDPMLHQPILVQFFLLQLKFFHPPLGHLLQLPVFVLSMRFKPLFPFQLPLYILGLYPLSMLLFILLPQPTFFKIFLFLLFLEHKTMIRLSLLI
jgi:hypothetical protein